MTSFAGSIGIIGIALILSLSAGVNDYIKNIERETLSQYPLQIQSTGFDFTSMMTGGEDSEEVKAVSAGTGNIFKRAGGKKKIIWGDRNMVTNMFSTMDSNDLESLKSF